MIYKQEIIGCLLGKCSEMKINVLVTDGKVRDENIQ